MNNPPVGGTFTVGTSDPVPYDATATDIQKAWDQAVARDRIAAVLNRHQPDQYDKWADCQCGRVGDDHVPDEVIRELQSDLAPLLKAYNEARQYDADCGEADNAGNDAGDKLARYITDWINA